MQTKEIATQQFFSNKNGVLSLTIIQQRFMNKNAVTFVQSQVHT